jgi:DNA-binding NtrC family response regulator
MDKNPRVLIIDDDKVIRETLAFTLEDEGYTVDTAENGKEAIEKTDSNFYNLAIVDWRLPDFEGTKLLRELKETTPRMAKIMLTGYPSMNNAIDAVNDSWNSRRRKTNTAKQRLLNSSKQKQAKP